MLNYIKTNFEQIMKWANIAFLFLFSLHLFNFPDKYIILWCVGMIVLFWIRNRKLCLDKMFWILALAIGLNGLGTYYYLADELSYTMGDIVKLVVPTILVYPFMKQVVCGKKESEIETIIWAIVLGTFVYSLLNHYSYLEHGFEVTERIWSEFWTNYPMNATHHSFWGCFISGMFGYGVYCLFEKKYIRSAIIFIFIVIENYIHIVVDNRMVLCVTVLAIVVSALLYFLLNIKDVAKIRKIVIWVMVGVAAIFIICSTNMFGINSSGYFQRFVTRDGGILNNVRFQMIYEAITMLPSHWKGGAEMWTAGYYHVHNYWLQVANVSGMIPFALWMIVNVSTVVDVVKIIKSEDISEKMKYILIPLWASIVGYLMMEPGGTELNRYIIFYIILIAILKQVVQKNHKENSVGVTNV